MGDSLPVVEPFTSPVIEVKNDGEARRRSLRNGANEKLLGMCLPLKYNNEMEDDAYGVTGNFLRVHHDRLV